MTHEPLAVRRRITTTGHAMKGTIGGLDGDGNFWCRSCIEASAEVQVIIVRYVPTIIRGNFICNLCDKLIENESHLEESR